MQWYQLVAPNFAKHSEERKWWAQGLKFLVHMWCKWLKASMPVLKEDPQLPSPQGFDC